MKKLQAGVLVIGGGCSGVAAGIASARMGVKTIIAEETPWLGGMITAAGVSAFDGNKYAVGGGIFDQMRKRIEAHYGGEDKTFTGWISLTCFEPKLGAEILSDIAAAEKELTVMHGLKFLRVTKTGDTVTGAVFTDAGNEEVEISAAMTIEATEWGDVIESAGLPYRFGRDSKEDTGEPDAPETPDYVVQDMTFCITLKKYEGKAPAVPASAEYNPELFVNSTDVHYTTRDEEYLGHKLHSWESMISYAALPNDKYLLNWPFHSNDYPTDEDVYLNPGRREYHFAKAKQLTLDYVHYMQTYLGHPEWGIATDEYPTEDNFPFIPYVRESRRIKGKSLLREQDVIPHGSSHRPKVQPASIAIGDYFLDHHHSKFFIEPIEERIVEHLPANAPFQIPVGCLIPEEGNGLLVAEKSISVTHIVNGCSRLQPVVMQLGEACGVLAALSVTLGVPPEEVPLEVLQTQLIENGLPLFPYKDLWYYHSAFSAAQKCALLGIFPDEDDFTFKPEAVVTEQDLSSWLNISGIPECNGFDAAALKGKTRAEAVAELEAFLSR